MKRYNPPRPARGRRNTAAARLWAWLPALLLAQLTLALCALIRQPVSSGQPLLLALVAIGNQLLFLLRAQPVLLALGCLLAAQRFQRLAVWTVGLLWALFLLAQGVLELYFRGAGVALGADLFGYSLEEIRTTLGGASGTVHGADLLVLLAPLLVLGLVLGWRSRADVSPPRWAWLPGLALAGVLAWALPLAPGATLLDGESARQAARSKGAYFVADTLRWWRLRILARTVQGGAWPFLHEENTPDTLGPYFGPTRDGRPPNVVVIVVEGLGRSFSGPEAPLGSFTPFLDALAARSLYFDNFLANQGRTFGVLPSLFASLPMAEQGFAALGPNMPAHAGLFNVLQRQGYHTRFYSGTDTSFDNERLFLQRQGVRDIVDARTFGPGYSRNPFSSWGYPDRELITRVLADAPRLPIPFVLGVQTISMHTSYRFPGQDIYKARLEQHLAALGIPPERRADYRVQADIYSAILYTDDQLRRYFEQVARMPWYADTIFVITGDHRLPEIPMATYIERYHVPLIVFSPLLRQPARIQAVSSHLDVTPSLLALLSNTYGLKRPSRVTWTGRGLDLATKFRSLGEFPLKQTKASPLDFVSGRWLLHDDRLFELQEGLRTDEVEDADLKARVQSRLDRYETANAAFLQRGQLSPDGDQPALVPYRVSAVSAPRSAPVTAPGLGIDTVALSVGSEAVTVQAVFVNGDAQPSRTFVPLAVFTDAAGNELHEAYGPALTLAPGATRAVQLRLPLPARPGQYFVAVRPSDPDDGKPVGRGRYHLPVDIREAAR